MQHSSRLNASEWSRARGVGSEKKLRGDFPSQSYMVLDLIDFTCSPIPLLTERALAGQPGNEGC